MKKLGLLLLISLIVLPGAYARKSRVLKPKNHVKRVTHIILGKSRNYYSLSNTNPSLITVEGPGTLRVITRARFEDDAPDRLSYTVVYAVDGSEQQAEEIRNTEPLKNGAYRNAALGKPGISEDFIIELGRGDHSIEFLLEDDPVKVAARYLFYPAKEKKVDWIKFDPLFPAEGVDLIARESIVHYFRASQDQPLEVEVIGPTMLRVLSRVENHYTMRGRINYRMQVIENGEVVNTYQLSSRRSQVTVYKDNPELIPGKGCTFVIEVPEGKHTYEIRPIDRDKSTVLCRFMIPEKDVRITE